MKRIGLALIVFAAVPAMAAPIEMSSWLTYQSRHEENLDLYGQKFTSICVFAYDFDESDNLRPAQPWVDSTLQQLMATKIPGRAVFITIVNDVESDTAPQNHSGALIQRILSDPVRRARHIQQLAALSAKADGIDIDYEGLLQETRPNYTQFMKELRAALPPGKLLSAVCQPKTDNNPGPRGQAIDWAINPFVDIMKIMTYYYAYGASVPGPSAPIDKVDQITQLAVNTIPMSKIQVVLTQFGWDWPDNAPGNFVTFDEAMQTAQAHGVTPIRDATEQTLKYSYVDGSGVGHQVWFDDDQSLRARIDVIEKRNVHKVDVWELGVGDLRFWQWARDNTTNGQQGNPVPVLSALVPNSAAVGSSAFTMTLNGNNFVSGAVVRWNGQNQATTFVNSGRLTINVPQTFLATVGTASVSVFNPAPGGGSSSALTFAVFNPNVSNPMPNVVSVEPPAVSAGGPAFTLTVNGSNFVGASVVRWNGSDRGTEFVSSTKLTAVILASDITTAGNAGVNVFNPAPGGGLSSEVSFSIVSAPMNPPPPAGQVGVFPDLAQVRAFPNPWKTNEHAGASITFDRLSADSTVKIFTMSSQWVKSLPSNQGSAEWNLRNDSGDSVASGYYLYVITDAAGNESKGRLAIIK